MEILLCGAREKDVKTNALEMEICWQEYDLWCYAERQTQMIKRGNNGEEYFYNYESIFL